MKRLLALACLLSFIATPAFAAINSSDTIDRSDAQKPQISCQRDIVRQYGLVVEIAVSCGSKSVIFAYSTVEKLYCDPKFHCRKDLNILKRIWFSNKSAKFK